MSRMIAAFCLLALIMIYSNGALTQPKTYSNLQAGNQCGQDDKIILTCAAGLSCKGGYCQFNSYLSGASKSCLEIMRKAGVVGERETVSVHDGFCYKHCDMYQRAIDASKATEAVLMRQLLPGDKTIADRAANLTGAEQALFKAAEAKCNSCGKQCVIGADFLGRGGDDGSHELMEPLPDWKH